MNLILNLIYSMSTKVMKNKNTISPKGIVVDSTSINENAESMIIESTSVPALSDIMNRIGEVVHYNSDLIIDIAKSIRKLHKTPFESGSIDNVKYIEPTESTPHTDALFELRTQLRYHSEALSDIRNILDSLTATKS